VIAGARYAHTNVTARDWERLASFYIEVFGCEEVPPVRDLEGAWLDEATGLSGAHLRGVHLRLPGHGPNGPTLEIFAYEDTEVRAPPMPNDTGYGHLAFQVVDVASALKDVLDDGGQLLGEISETDVPGVGRLEVVYARDPEGNIIELQAWHAPEL
jgi:glyoxylase I family protein